MGNSQEEETPFGGLFGQTLIERQIAQIEITQDERGIDWSLPEEEKAVLNKLVLEPLSRPSEPDEIASLTWSGSMMVCGFSLGFLPSECLNSLKRASLRAVADQSVSVTLDDSELNFWLGCALYMQRDYLASRDLLQKVKDNALLPRKILLASLQLCAWSQFHLLNYNEALETLNILKARVSTAEGKERASFLIGYLSALVEEPEFEEFPLGPEVHVVLPEEEFGETLPESASLTELSHIPIFQTTALELLLQEMVVGPLRLSMLKQTEEIKKEIEKPPNYERTLEGIAKEYGAWVNELQNIGELANAEFLFEALGKKSWGTVAMGYSNALEGEVKVRLWPLVECLRRHEVPTIPTQKGDIKLSDIRLNISEAALVLKIIGATPFLKACLADLVPDDCHTFLFQELPEKLQQVNEARSKLRSTSPNSIPSLPIAGAAHASKLAYEIAKAVKELVLGTPSKPGILKKVYEIQLGG